MQLRLTPAVMKRLVPLIPIALVLIAQAAVGPSFFDDAYISFRYARNIALGQEFVYNPGEPVLGTTTPLFTLVLALIATLSGPDAIPPASFLVSLAADCASAWLIFRLARTAFTSNWAATFLSAAWALHPLRLSVAVGGMEASLITLLLLAAFERLIVSRSFTAGAAFAALSVLTRPDSIIALAPIFGYLLLRDRPFAFNTSLLALVLTVPWLIWSTMYFGGPIPNSMLAKGLAYQNLPGFAAYFILGFLGTGTVGQFNITPLLLGSAILSVTVISIGSFNLARRESRFLPLVAFGPLFLTIMALANAPMFFPWYYLPILPSLLFSIAACLWFLPGVSTVVRRGVFSLTLVALLAVPSYFIHFSPSWPLSRDREAAYFHACSYLRSSVTPSEVVLAPDVGVIGWCLPNARILDPVGLISTDALARARAWSQGPAVALPLMLAVKPDYIVSLEMYLTSIDSSSEFLNDYQLVWEETVAITGQAQDLRIYARRADVSGPFLTSRQASN